MHIHIVGICGAFMGGLAVLARQSGHKVTGCDDGVYPPMSTQLESQGIELIQGYSADQIGVEPDSFVIGNVVTRGNPLMEEILNCHLPYISGPQWLSEQILKDKWVLAVTGTHGKTTTSSMLAWILEYAGLHPGFLIGGIPENFGISARLGNFDKANNTEINTASFFVIEADEYDTAFFDKRSKFIHYQPRTVILNNLEFDHADIFDDLGAIERQFHHLVRIIPNNGLIIANGCEVSLQRVLSIGCWTPIEEFATQDGWQISPQYEDKLEIHFKGKSQGFIQWDLLGEHNSLNALAALGAARHAGVPSNVGIAALQQFKNVKRRMEVRSVINNITIYDDFAHHPTSIAATLKGLRRKVRDANIIAVLEMRSNTMKMGIWKDSLAASLAIADNAFCYTSQPNRSIQTPLQSLGSKITCYDNQVKLIKAISSIVKPGDFVLIMSNGSFDDIHEKLLNSLRRKFSNCLT